MPVFWLIRSLRRILPPMRGMNFITLFVLLEFIGLSFAYWLTPMNSPELPEFARHTPGRWYFYLFLTSLCMLQALVYTGMFWGGLARFSVRTVWFSLRAVWWIVAWTLRGLVWAVYGAYRAVRRGAVSVAAARRRRRIARMPKRKTIDVEYEWVDVQSGKRSA